jgi:ribonuclease BN (tRNA processing enzyme)
MPGDVVAKHRRPPARVITLTPVGTAAAFGGVGEAQSSYLVQAGDLALLLDMGSGSLAALCAIHPPESLDAVFISHMHADHCVDLLALHVHMQWGPGRGRVLTVHCPPGLPERLAAFGGGGPWTEEQGLRFVPLAPGAGSVRMGEVLLRHAEVPHLPPTHAMRVEHASSSLCFGADCAPSDELVSLAAGCDALLVECAFGADPVPPGLPHLNADAAGDIARRAGVSSLLLTHCQGGHDRDAALRRARAVFGGPVEWAQPGRAVRL